MTLYQDVSSTTLYLVWLGKQEFIEFITSSIFILKVTIANLAAYLDHVKSINVDMIFKSNNKTVLVLYS